MLTSASCGDGMLRLRKQFSLTSLRRRMNRCHSDAAITSVGDSSKRLDSDTEHLLEHVEPVSTSETMINKENKEGEKREDIVDKSKLPSSLVTLTESEKRQLQDVLMRIGLRECGL